jgi:hypothetical protein
MNEETIRVLARLRFGEGITSETRLIHAPGKTEVYYPLKHSAGGCCELRLYRHLETGVDFAMGYEPAIDTVFWDVPGERP